LWRVGYCSACDCTVGRRKMSKNTAISLRHSQSASVRVRFCRTDSSHCCSLKTVRIALSIRSIALIILSVEFHRIGMSHIRSMYLILYTLHIAFNSTRGSFRSLKRIARLRVLKKAERSLSSLAKTASLLTCW